MDQADLNTAEVQEALGILIAAANSSNEVPEGNDLIAAANSPSEGAAEGPISSASPTRATQSRQIRSEKLIQRFQETNLSATQARNHSDSKKRNLSATQATQSRQVRSEKLIQRFQETNLSARSLKRGQKRGGSPKVEANDRS